MFWVLCRPEQRIAVVSHAGFIRHTLSAFAGGLPAVAAEALQREFSNCELRTVVSRHPIPKPCRMKPVAMLR